MAPKFPIINSANEPGYEYIDAPAIFLQAAEDALRLEQIEQQLEDCKARDPLVKALTKRLEDVIIERDQWRDKFQRHFSAGRREAPEGR